MLLKLLKKANEGDQQEWRHRHEQQREGHLAEDLRPARAVDARGLAELVGNRLQGTRADEEEGEAEPEVDEDAGHLAHAASNSHGTWMPSVLLMTPKSSFSMPPQTSTARKAGIA